MSPKFNIDRPRISDEEIDKHKDFSHLVEQFKQQSLKQARGDESWWKDKKIRYSTVIAGATVICTVTYFSLFNNKAVKQNKAHETLITQKNTGSPAPKAFISAPSQKLRINYTAYTVNNNKGATITHTTASKIKIPKNSFVDKNGKDIVGDVTIEYKEFHDIGDVIAGGIPMAYDSAGTKYNLETAGMFDIRGSQKGEPVFIKADKNLEVELASRNGEDKFNQYYLDTLDKNWHYIKRDKTNSFTASEHNKPARNTQPSVEALAAKDPKLVSLKREIEVVIPKKIDSVKTVYTKRAEKLPAAKEPAKPAKATGRPIFQLEASTGDFPELAAFGNVVFEVGSENKNYTNELQNITWSDVKISQGTVKGKNYLLTLIYRGRTEKLLVYPVLSGADYEKAKDLYDERLQAYQALVEKRQAEEKRLMAEMAAKQAAYVAEQKKKEDDYKAGVEKLKIQAEIARQKELMLGFDNLSNDVKARRLFNVTKFGIYNSDCPHTVPQGAAIVPVFVLDEQGLPVNPDVIYLIDHSAKTVYMRNQQDGFKMNYNPESDYSVCVFAGNKLYLCSKEHFRQAAGKESNRFTVTPMPGNADNIGDFKKALEI